jgi:hypothetical protein
MAAVNSDVTAFGRIENGRLFIRNRREFDQQIGQIREGAEVEIEVTLRRATRSVLQNAYYWGVVVHLVSEYTGFAPDDMHEWFKAKFIPKRLAVCDGNGEIQEELVLGGSTRKMNKLEFGEYMESIRQWAAETLDVVIPDPDPDYASAEQTELTHGWGV